MYLLPAPHTSPLVEGLAIFLNEADTLLLNIVILFQSICSKFQLYFFYTIDNIVCQNKLI